jgi:hypothetical protein
VTITDILILASAVLSIIKSLLAIGTYSNWHVLLAVIEFVCTALAFSIFILDDFVGVDGTVPFGSDDLSIFLLAFVSSCIIEVIDVFFTYNTVRAYRSVHKENDYDRMRQRRKNVKSNYTFCFIFTSTFVGITPLVSFGKSGWNKEYFSPSPFSPQNSKFLLICLIMMLSALIIYAFAAIKGTSACVGLIIVPASILVYVVLARVTGAEAGSLVSSYFV